ncbi:hypothetical protein U9M48_004299 [Paspalum notatum var. saurae]|uniref:CCHC-type domain-containing protein n=1 Tax=Paspalum notatum var. saurae TaxID=547442 RepID=A0AAQ3PJQ2_PASNO
MDNQPFSGKEDPNQRLKTFLQICNTFNIDGVTNDQIRARLFPFSLIGKSHQWLSTLPETTINNWPQLLQAFIAKYFSPGKTQALRNKISTFAQYPTETFDEAYERFNDYVSACPHHNFQKWDLIQKFYGGLNAVCRAQIDASSGGSILSLTPTETQALFKKIAENGTWGIVADRVAPTPSTGVVKSVLEVEKVEILCEKIDSLLRRIEKMESGRAEEVKSTEARMTCGECGEYGHSKESCPEEAEALDYARKEEQAKINKDTHSKFKAMDKVLENIDGKITTVGSSNQQLMGMMKILENQLSQLAEHLPNKNEGKLLPRQPQPKESLKAVTTRSERETRDPEVPTRLASSVEAEAQSEDEPEVTVEDTRILPEKSRVRVNRIDEHFSKFLEVIKQLYIHMPLLDALQVPTYAKYFKDILANKREMPSECVKLTTECSAAVMDTPLQKKADPGCLTIPCSIGALNIDKALCDLGASVSVMPKSVFDKLKLPKPEPTSMCLELADHLVRYPEVVAENVPIKIGANLVPVDFVILEMGGSTRSPLILGRPFLRTAQANINVGEGMIKFNINGESSLFKSRPRFEVCQAIEGDEA